MADTKQLPNSVKRRPPAAGKGRPKGAVNKLTKTIKEAIEVAFDRVGGPNYLVRMAEEQPTAFLTLLGKVLPTQMEHSGPDGGAIQMEQVKNDAAAFASAVAGLASRSGTPSAD